MKKALLFFTIFLVSVSLAYGQQRQVSGKVTGSDGAPIPFATVQIKGTNSGTTADADGRFVLKVSTGTVLKVSALGMEDKEITVGSGNIVAVALNVSDVNLKEVTVTGAFGIKKAQRNTSYSSQVIGTEQLNVIPQTNVNNALAGKVAGVQFQGQSPMKLDAQGFLRIRGGLGLKDVDPIYVVDGTIVGAFEINPNDIADVTILKGANATALLGGRARNGAIMITTKKGSKGGFGIEVNQGITFDKVYILPKYQNQYAGGGVSSLIPFKYEAGMPDEWKALDGKSYLDHTDDASWGPRIEGQEYAPWYAWIPGTQYTGKTERLQAQPNNVRDFYQTGITSNTNVALTKGGEQYNMRISYTNQSVKGMLPGTSSKRNALSFNGSYDLNPHFTTGANVNYTTTNIRGEFDDAYSNQSAGNFSQWFHRELDMSKLRELRGLRNPTGTLAGWNGNNPDSYLDLGPTDYWKNNYWYNPYAYFDNIDYNQTRNRLFGDAFLTYKFNDALSLRGTIRKDLLTTNRENKIKSIIERSGGQTGKLASYDTRLESYDETNYELIATYNKKITDFDINVTAGGNIFTREEKTALQKTSNGLIIPDLFAITNSKDQPSLENIRRSYKTNSLFASGEFGYKRIININAAVRADWYSTLPSSGNRLISPSVGGTFIFSELTHNALPWLSFGKVFASWGKKPLDLGFHEANFSYKLDQFQWGSNIVMRTPNSFPDSTLKGSLITTYEAGFDVRFLDNRFGLNALYYNEDNNNAPLPVTVGGAGGFTTRVVNAARVKRTGIELLLTAKILQSKDFTWDVSKSFSYLLSNKVVSLYNNVDRIQLDATAFGTRFARAFQQKGENWGQLIGAGIKRNADGQPLLDPVLGTYVTDSEKKWGSIVPRITGGLTNTFSYKDFTLAFSVDYQVGGKFFSLTENFSTFSGLLDVTASTNDKGKNVRDDVANGGGVHVTGVSTADGKTPVDLYIPAKRYYQQYYNNQIAEPFIHDLTFVKLREISLGYNLPLRKWGVTNWVKGMYVSVLARNPWLIYREAKNFDPSEISNNAGESGQFPGTRSLGFNVKFSF
ncbi:TonB-dependent receptor [Chitinophaga pendula]|uniref:SusC/RagA family TonB-linked outer membrane protein n=1 Tax=Chitinophaga TaxID=79328 RepID=UPI000BAF9B1C|nr:MULTISPECIES: SusC/RagA family TonB-linked outer membrane protein [Chitinophaga]ASZ14605.1 hypothetical protein CK934_28455 [Chitinophaga sp. MD30]UCJ07742.1 TonB-dependent receptor [Chitinophaga pendula]